MELVEIRQLDGPNLFLRQPAVKIEVASGDGEPLVAEAFASAFIIDHVVRPELAASLVAVPAARLETLLIEAINALHDHAGVDRLPIVSRQLESPGHMAVAFGWTYRTLARQIARAAWQLVSGDLDGLDERLADIARLGATAPTDADLPEVLLDANRLVPVIAVTGTNGKTTTTRLIASILMHAGRRVGWTSSAGVLIQGEPVLDGDYTGPAGAARVFEEPDLDVAILETARGGILLRGLGYESNDVSVVTNVSADHLGLQGVYTVEELARVKSIVPAVTRRDGFAVLNADDPLVLGMRGVIAARTILVSRDPANPEISRQRRERGWALWVDDGLVHVAHGGESVLTDLNDVPITFGGKAAHMVENALCAAAACLAIGLDLDQVRSGLAAFRNEADQNRGRLNVYDVGEGKVVVDYAHNVVGLRHLLGFGRGLVTGSGRLVAVIGTAGDRPDRDFVELGRLAGTFADRVVVKDTLSFLRGREPGQAIELMLAGVADTGAVDTQTAADEYEGFESAIAGIGAGDVVVVMAVQEADRILAHLDKVGTPVS